MKVAVCYSGLFREFKGWQENHKFITKHADDIFYSTWEGRPQPPVENCMVFTEPKIDYNPFLTREFKDKYPKISKKYYGKEVKEWCTKQILAHEFVVDALPNDYDIVIRMRYDVWLGDHDWLKYIKQSYDKNCVVSFGSVNGEMDNTPNICDKIISAEELQVMKPTVDSLTDFMNIHPPYKIKGAYELFKNKELFCANKGWYQVMVNPYEEKHINYGGGVMLARNGNSFTTPPNDQIEEKK